MGWGVLHIVVGILGSGEGRSMGWEFILDGRRGGGWLEGGQVGTHLSCFSLAGGDERGHCLAAVHLPDQGGGKEALGTRVSSELESYSCHAPAVAPQASECICLNFCSLSIK